MQLSDSAKSSLQLKLPGIESPLPEQAPQSPPEATPPTPRQPRFPMGKLVAATALSVAAVTGGLYAFHAWQFASTHEETDNAYITSDIDPVSARVTGTVKDVLVKDNQPVKRGQVLLRLDPSDAQVSLQQARAALAVAQEQARVAQANINVARAGIDVTKTNAQGQTTQAAGNIEVAQAGIATAQASVAEAQAGVPAARAQLEQVKANLVKAELDYNRYADLYQQGAVPKQQLDTAKAAYDALKAQRSAVQEQIAQAEARVAQAQQNLASAEAKLNSTKGTLQQANATSQQAEVNRQQTLVSERQYQAAIAAVAQAQAQVKTAQLQLSYTTITAPNDGQIGNKVVQLGQRVQPGQTLLAVVEKSPWIIANFKETQLGKMHPGQEVEVKLDAFPGQVFHGKIDSLAPASGAKFALLPPDNATGNFTKIVQRVPVKVVLDPNSVKGHAAEITPGMSATVSVTTHQD